MLHVVLAQVRANAGRMVASCLAVAVAVAFVVATLGLSASSERSVLDALGAQFSSTDVVVTDPDLGDRATLDAAQATLADDPAVSALTADYDLSVRLRVPGRSGSQIVPVRSVAAPGPLRWQQVASGRLPDASAEVAVNERVGAAVGDVLTVLPQARGEINVGTAEPVAEQVRVVGVVDLGADPQAGVTGQVFASVAQTRAWGADAPGRLRLRAADGGTSAADLERDVRTALAAAPSTAGLSVATGEASAAQAADSYARGTAGLSGVLLVFAAVALVVAGLVIANTFAVVLAQRTRELALLRCVGATARQVRRGVLVEAGVVGLGASLVGAAAGLALSVTATLALAHLESPVPLGAVVVPFGGIALGVGLGTGLTFLAALVPARAATQVAPLAALRPLDQVPARSRGGRLRLGAGLLLLVPSVAALLVLAGDGRLRPAVAAGAVSFLAMVLVAQRAVPPAVALVGRLLAPLGGVPADLAARNAARNPRRTAATATALMVAATLTAAVVVGAATTRETASSALAAGYPVDAVVTANDPLPGPLAERLAGLEDVAGTAALRSAPVTVLGQDLQALGVDPAEGARAVRSATSQPVPRPGEVVLRAADARALRLDDRARVTVAGASGKRDLTVRIAAGADVQMLLDSADLVALDAGAPLAQVWVRLADGLGDEAQAEAVDRVTEVSADLAPTSSVAAQGAERRALNDLLDTLLFVVTGLLAVAVLIAVLGVGNTLALSVLERRRESGLLRALGLTRRQLRTTLLWEAVLVAGVAAGLGCGLGVLYGVTGTQAVIGSAVSVQVVVPWLQLAGILAVSAVAGAIASVLPARRAARVVPALALAG